MLIDISPIIRILYYDFNIKAILHHDNFIGINKEFTKE